MPEWSTVPAPGSRVLVTGAAGGLGRALSSALAEVGAEVVGIDLPGTEATATADLTDDDSARRAVADAVERLGGLNALIGAAGVLGLTRSLAAEWGSAGIRVNAVVPELGQAGLHR